MLAAALLAGGGPALAQARKTPAQPPTGPQPILRADFLAQMDAQFGKMDGDRNGQLSRAEIEQFELEKALAEARARNDALFDQLDVNKNGQISSREFDKLVPEKPLAAGAQPMLSREDSNRDGQISLIEHRSATLANFDRLDFDRDGVVSASEMRTGGITPR
ncbi:MAG TPA: hypothetical protein VFO32_00205 [Sphingomicrobium sp.]|nr:hypothetical protein [Sphingomicrobium sp.]